MALFHGFTTIPTFERWACQLRIDCPHAVVGHWQHSWSGSNRLPRNRLFLVDGPQQAGSIAWGTQHIALQAGHRYVMPAHADLRFHFAQGLRMVAFHFDCELIPGLDCFASCNQILASPFPRARTKRLARCLQALDTPAALVAAHGEFTAAISDCVPMSWQELRRHNLLDGQYGHLLAMIDHAGAATRIADLASTLHLTADQLSKRFKRDCGVALKTFIDRRITRRAADLLRDTELSIGAIATELGFTNEFYASRFLHRHLGMPPSVWRRLPLAERL
ncbi:MAG: helix-turn-helix transcriptional regulator [Planctomycetota bacterium]|jgi:AraC-like DNA-binding protein|nr:helix-turn-helix transcriptional regulator [Planctomycetota bacterium]